MQKNNAKLPHFSLVLILFLLVSVTACSKTMEWKEEVQLHDGQVILSERHYSLDGYPTIESHERAAIDETVTFNLPNSKKKIVWKTNFSNSIPDPNGLIHIRFDVIKGVPYLVTYPANCIAYNKWGRPNPPQVLFKYVSNQWIRIASDELPVELVKAKANVVVGKPAAELLKSSYSVAQVNEQNRYINTPQYHIVLRDPLPRYGKNCSELVYDGKGGWIGIGWFRDKSSLKACLNYCDREKIPTQYCPCNTLFKGK